MLHATYIKRKIGIFLLVGVLLLNAFSFVSPDFVTTVSAATNPPLKLKWSRNLGIAGHTTLAPLAADLNKDGNLEIVVTGGSSYGGSDGYVTTLDGATGSTVWQARPGGIGTHSGFDIADLNKDGFPEIIVSAKSELVLYGKDGSVYWRNPGAPAGNEGLYQAVLDIDGSGYPTIFASSGEGPYKGYDYVTSLRYDGQILHQAFSWHPCYGGLTVADANFDGKFELYQGDRSKAYNPSNDSFSGGGQGLHAYDASTLKLLWKDDTILCSSQCPVLADVDGDGILDVIVADQGNDGIAVVRSTDGSVLKTGGVYRKGGTHMPSHSQVTVCDVDGDGRLELIDNNYSKPKIWDLYAWKLDGILDAVCCEPPKIGDVTGDNSNPDIIAVTGNVTSSIIIYNYNKPNRKYQRVFTLSGFPNVPFSANAFTLVQDVDSDGLNELVVTSQSGYVYCYDALGRASSPRIDSSLQFYSEYKRGVAEYVSHTLLGAVTVTNPNSGLNWIRGTIHTITWTSTGSPGNSVKIELLKGGVLNTVVSSSTTNDGSYSWTIPSTQTVGSDYQIRITSTSITSITDTSDDNFTISARAPRVTIPGDINGDSRVNLQDLVLLANAYGSHANNVKWNPNADINGNGAVDLADLVILALHYGQHYP